MKTSVKKFLGRLLYAAGPMLISVVVILAFIGELLRNPLYAVEAVFAIAIMIVVSLLIFCVVDEFKDRWRRYEKR